MSNSANPLELAKKGHPQAIAYLINQQLKARGITAKAERRGSSLLIDLESLDQVPQDSVFPMIENGIRKLEIPNLGSLMVTCRLLGSSDTLWQEQVFFNMEVEDFQSVDRSSLPPVTSTQEMAVPSQTGSLNNDPQVTQSVKGKILNFSIQNNSGLISGNDGRRYRFTGSSWNIDQPPTQGIAVEFEVDSNGKAIEIYLDPNSQFVVPSTLVRAFSSSNRNKPTGDPVDLKTALIYFFLCMPLGFAQWGQSSKGWAWVLISLLTSGLGSLPAMVDYWMCFTAQKKHSLKEWDFFPQ